VRRAEDCAVPVGHEKIIAFVQAVGACLCSVEFVVSGSVPLARLHCDCTHACMLADRGSVRTGSETFLALLQLFQQAEVTRYFCAHGCVVLCCDWRVVVGVGASLRLLGEAAGRYR
jgi:hypothetical protein